MKNTVYSIFVLILLIFISCSKKSKREIEDHTLQFKGKSTTRMKNLDIHNITTICECSYKGIEILNQALMLREKYSNLSEYNKDEKSAQRMTTIIGNWNKLRDTCLKKFGVKLFEPTDCNRPDMIHKLRENLDALGIKTS